MKNKILLLALAFICSIGISFGQIYTTSGNNGQTITTCKGNFQQSGSTAFACSNYGTNLNQTVTFCSGNGGPIRVSFIDWDLENTFDHLFVYDGPTTASPQIADITGSGDIFNPHGPRAYTSSGTCLTFRFTSDNSVTGCGWDAIIGCPPTACGTNAPANDFCGSAPQICDINGYCGNTSGWFTQDNGSIGITGSSLFCGSIENNSWLSFIASSTTATLTINSANCVNAGSGIQAQVFSTTNCTSFTSRSNCVNQNAGSGSSVLTATGLTIGQKYYVMVDGFAGNICDYTVSANTGVQVIRLTSNPVNARICPGQTATIKVNGAPAGTTFSWTPTGTIIGSTTDSVVTVQPGSTTTYNCLITLPNGCGIQNETYTITVNPTPTTPITRNICQGQSTVFNGQTLTVAGTYRDTFVTSLGCDSFVVLTLNVNPAKTTNLPDRIFCQGQSTTFNGQTITTSGTYRDTIVTSLGCDSFLILNVIVNPVKTTPISQAICNGTSIVFNGQTISTAGTYRDTLTTSLGCDSFIVLTVTIKPTPTTNIAQAICNGTSIVFNGQTITTAGTYRDTLVTSLGCDSFIVLTVTLNPTPTTNIAQAICNGTSIVFNGNTITTAGTFRDTLRTSLGCDSFIVLTVTIKPTPTTNISRAICNGSSTVFNGQTITTAGTFRDTLTTSLGCDSFIVLTVTLNPTPTTNISRAICNGSSTVFNGQTITTAGTFRDTLTTSLGCDSFIVLTVTVNPTPTTNISRAICNGSSTVFNGQTITTAGTFRDTLTTSLGCDSFIVLTVTIKPTPTTNISQQLCNGQTVVFNGQTISTAGTYRDTLTTSLGCDSFIVLTVTVVPFKTTNIAQSICPGQSIQFNGNVITTAGTFRDTLTTSLGCDSFIVLTVSLNPTPTTNIAQAICNGTSIVFNGNTITTAGTFRDTLRTSLGCDSFIVLTVTIKPTPTTNISRAICNGSSTVFNGQTITTAGTFRDTLTTSLGCDSFIVLTVTLNPTPTTNISRAICNGSSTVFNGQTITTAGTFRDTLTTSLGCDSFIVLTVTVNPTPTTNISRAICNGSSTVFNGQTITTAGTFRDTLTTSLGCDSFIVLTVTVNPTPTTNISQQLCNGQTVVFNGQTISTAGTYRDTLTTSLGCDSFIVLTVTVVPFKTTNIAQSICPGQSIQFNGNVITTAGTFRDTLQTTQLCDSFIVLTVTLNPTPTTNIAQAICNGTSIVFNGNTITTAGTFRDTLRTSLGCDSFIVLTVTIKPTPTTNISRAICNGSSTVFNGQTITTAGTFRDTLTTSLGCDSFIVLTVTVNPTPTTNISRAICNGNSTVFNGQTITTAGTFRDTLTTSLGCDSFIVLTVTVNPTPNTNISQQLCNGQTVVFNGQTISVAGTYRDTLTTSLGCDSFIVLTVTVVPFKTTNIAQSICPGQSIQFNGNVITTAGTFRDTLQTTQGCDSFIVLTVTLNPTPTTNIDQAICNGTSIVFNGNTITTAGTFRDTLRTSLGCDSFIVLTVTIKPTPTTNIAQAICNGTSIVFNGQTITTAGTFRDTLTTSLGCDSFIVLTVSVNPTPTTNISRAICNGSSTVFNGQTITTAGTFRDTLTTSLGCDSFIVLTVTVNPTPTTNISQQLCNGQTVVFNGQTISTAGTYRDTLTTSLGCDSFIVLTVTVVPFKTTNIAQSICPGQSIQFNGNVITTAGTFRDTLQTTQLCDSFIVLTVTLNPTPTTNIDQAICNGTSIVFNGNTITTAGTFRDTLRTSLGCDSFIVLTVTIKPTPTTNIAQAICNGTSIVFNGQTITTAGTFRDTLVTSLGCDSFIVLTVTIKPTPTTNISQAICNGTSIVFNGQTISAAGTYRDTLVTSLGCDSFVVLTVIVNPTPTTQITQAICQGDFITFNGQIITTAGTYSDTLSTTLDCDSFVVLTVTVNSTATTNIEQAICEGDFITFNGLTITTAGTYFDTLSTTLDCDSFVVLTVTVNSTATTNIEQAICEGDFITFNGQIITTAGTYSDTLSTTLDCDSFVVLTVIVNSTATTNIEQAICEGDFITFNGQTITTAGTYNDTLSTSFGCDSFVVLTVIVNPTPTTQITEEICQGGFVLFNGQSITEAGVYNDTLSTSFGCDSFIVLTVRIKPTPTTNLNQAICNGTTYEFNGQTISAPGVYIDTLVTILGCDSFIVLNLTINSTPTTSFRQSICAGTSYQFNGRTLTESGTYLDTLTTSLGCDSILNLNLTVESAPIFDAVSDKPIAGPGEQIQLNVTTSEALTYNWTPTGSVSSTTIQNPTATITESTWFVVEVSVVDGNSQCRTKDSVFVEFNDIECNKDNVYLPNAFSPNGDGTNDVFIVRSTILKSGKLVVFDRWGNQVFETTDLSIGWDGIYKGQPAQVDAYGFYFVGECVQGEKITLKGNVTLLR